MAKIPRNSFSRLSVLATERAEYMQGLTVEYINDQFAADSDTVDINSMTFGDFMAALNKAEENGTREEFEAVLARQLLPIVEQVMAMSQQPQPPQEGV